MVRIEEGTGKLKNSGLAIKNSGVPEIRAIPYGHIYKIYIYGPIEDSSEFVDAITILDTATEADIVEVRLDTPGGSLNTAIAFIHAIWRSEAQVVGYADGEVASAGVPIFLACPSYIISPFSHFMIHDASTVNGGKLSENFKSIESSMALVKKLSYQLYCPVFSEEEVEKVLLGQDIYCSSDEMTERIKRVSEEEEEQQEEEDDQA